ncbi:hypothetical protein [Natrinema salifodinae]|nr:hypothetical protein [Natrinema salifodinae]
MSDAEKIATCEKYRRGDLSEQEARERLGDDVIDAMRDDREAFEAAIEMSDISDFLQQNNGDEWVVNVYER